MSAVKKTVAIMAGFLTLAVPATAATPKAAWSIQPLAMPTVFAPGEQSEENKKPSYQVFITNSGGASTDRSPIRITDTLPAGVVVEKVELRPPRARVTGVCKTEVVAEVSTVSCEVTEADETSPQPKQEPARLSPGDQMLLQIKVTVPESMSGKLVNEVTVEGGGAETVMTTGENEVGTENAKAGFEEFRAELTGADGRPASIAGSHPYQYTTSFGLNVIPAPPQATGAVLPAGGDVKEIEVALPPGLAGNPQSIARCTAQQFTTHKNVFSPLRGVFVTTNECPRASVVGVASVEQLEGVSNIESTPIYNLVPPKGMPAQLGFEILALPIYINTRVRSESDYGITGFLHNVTQAKRITAGRFTIWGTPWDKSHDGLRGECALSWESCEAEGEGAERSFLRMPSSCGNPLVSMMSLETWAQPPGAASEPSVEEVPTGCAAVPFEPAIESRPSTNAADSPAGLHFDLQIPQEEHEAPAATGEADLREASVTLPKGLVLNPASADGRMACAPAQVGLSTAPGTLPAHFSTAPAQCPDAAKVGSVEAVVPALDHPIVGGVYLATQEDNPFNSFAALYVVLEDPESGIVVKLAGKVALDPATGQVTTTFADNPQVPVEHFRFDFFEGARAPLRTPMSCGDYTTTSTMTPWSAPAGLPTNPSDSFHVGSGPQGPCPTGALDPKLDAGFANPTAGTYSPFSLRVSRADGTGEFAGLTTTPPLGFTARLAGVPYCPQAGIDQATAREHPGQGALELQSPSCPPASQVGTVTAGAGAGPTPIYTSGRLYLAGPYKGAPLSLVAIIPAIAGPFDLGTVTSRVAARLDPETAQVTAVTDPLPLIRSGVVLDLRDLRVDIDRPNFALAPTSCEPKSVGATVQGTAGNSATVSERFQVGGCGALKFKPGISLTLKGGTKRSDHPALKAVLTYPQKGNYANTAKASVGLPHSEFLDQAHIHTICTRVQFAADACPKGAIYGKAKAFTPLLDKPLQGPIYLRSSSNPLPDMVLDLHGQIDVVAVGRIDSHKGGIRTSFEAVPDAPLSKVVVELPAGKKGLLVNSRNICKHTNRATARFTAHNGKSSESRPVLKSGCGGKGSKRSS
jgi:hypothetical protein